MNVIEEYETVNAALAFVGQDPIRVPSDGTDRQKVEFLLNTYVERLQQAVPEYKNLKENRPIPDLVVQHLLSVLREK